MKDLVLATITFHTSTTEGSRTAARVRRAGTLCLWAGLTGAASGVALALVPVAVAEGHYSYPLSPGVYVVVQVWFVVQHLGLLAGVAGVVWSGVAGSRRLGPGAAFAGLALLTVTEALAIAAWRATDSTPIAGFLDGLYGIAMLTAGLGLVVAGLSVVRAQRWSGGYRYVLLAIGIYVFFPMIPAIFAGFTEARLAITGWMALFAVLGHALVRESS